MKARAGYEEEETLNIREDWENLVKDRRFKIQFMFRDKLIGADISSKKLTVQSTSSLAQ